MHKHKYIRICKLHNLVHILFHNVLFMYIQQQNVSLIISNGVPKLDLSLNAIHKQYLNSEVFVSDGEWHYATILIEETVASINIDGEMRMLTLDMFAKPLLSPVELYLGGYDESMYVCIIIYIYVSTSFSTYM